MRLSEAVRGFLIARIADGYSHNTINIYRHHLAQMAEYLADPPAGKRNLSRRSRFLRLAPG